MMNSCTDIFDNLRKFRQSLILYIMVFNLPYCLVKRFCCTKMVPPNLLLIRTFTISKYFVYSSTLLYYWLVSTYFVVLFRIDIGCVYFTLISISHFFIQFSTTCISCCKYVSTWSAFTDVVHLARPSAWMYDFVSSSYLVSVDAEYYYWWC